MRMYVIVDSQYPAEYRAVQGGHALAAYMLKYPESTWKNETLIYLKTSDLSRWKDKLEFIRKDFAYFVEPDVGNKITALATVDTGKMFSKLELN